MTFNSNQEQYKGSIWNPFVPTKRDIERTDELASKNAVIAGVLGFIFPIGAAFYLNRISNSLKLGMYFMIIIFPILFSVQSQFIERFKNIENAEQLTEEQFIEKVNTINQEYIPVIRGINFLISIAFMAESARAVTLARKRQSENNL
jgi:hypothetical protein